MALDTQRWQFTVSDFLRMGKAGIFSKDDRVELMDGEIRAMSPVGPEHVAVINRLNVCLHRLFGTDAIVSVQNPVQLNDFTEPLPDLAVLRFRENFYADAHPVPDDVLLLIEVADSSLGYDSNEKLSRYAQAGIFEYWIVDVERKRVIQYTTPDVTSYQTETVLDESATIVLAAAPDLSLLVTDIF